MPLEHLPNEIIETILSHLALHDIRNFRLTSRASASTSSHHFKSFLRRKHVDVTESSLRSFLQATNPGHIGSFVTDVVLVGVVNNPKWLNRRIKDPTDGHKCDMPGVGPEGQARAQADLDLLMQRQRDYERMRATGTDVTLLAEAFTNLMVPNHDERPGLRSLTLEVVVYRLDAEQRLPPADGGSWTLIWQAAAATFHTAMRALAASQMPLQELDVYSHLSRCSLACTELSAVDIESNGLTASLASLRSLSISFSDRIVDMRKHHFDITGDSADDVDWGDPAQDEERSDDEIEAELLDTSNFTGLARFLHRCTALEDLELHVFKLITSGLDNLYVRRDAYLHSILAINTPFPYLRRLTLRGVRARGPDLLAFIKALPIRELRMVNVKLLVGTFAPIFDYCVSHEAALERLYLDDLFDPNPLAHVYFDGETGKPTRIDFKRPCSNLLERTGMDVRRAIPYFTPVGTRLTENPRARRMWKWRRRAEYGPP
ncbi:F-box domain protein [Aspergillus mulundensis]|uniref:F-box domain-containing protein n=1 Tax=Aspergillus mulundensis TaxID=1810919 RepID=A0A3D8T479_9EURO|nr:hypothetical protein DSM5745_00694 [Aspergillus mulundensis]RDW93372.1 hypothetical protein DSM5745_00694 [Aspergillus mulundensis]